MNFIFKMAWRDTRASRRRLALVAVSVVLGIAALVGIASLGVNLQRTVETQTKGLLGADLTVTSRQAFSDEARAYFRSLGGELATETGLASMITFTSRGNARRLVQVRAIEGNFPFYGEVTTEPANLIAKLPAGNFAMLEQTLLVQYGAQVGDEVRIGAGTFTIIGALKKIPGESAAIAMFSPRVYLSPASLAATGLMKRESFVTRRVHLKLPTAVDPEALVKTMREKFRAQQWRYATVEERKRDLGQTMKDVYSFLSLVGFIALFLGAVGVASAMHVYIKQKIATVAVLRCLGATNRASFAVYLLQGCGIGLLGAVLGALAGVGVQLILPVVLKDFLPFQVELFISWLAVAKGMLAGWVICVLFTLLPLLSVRRVSPLLAIRSAQGESTTPDPWRWGIYGSIAAAVLGFSMLQAGSWKAGLGFTLAMTFGFGVLAGMAQLVSWAARRFTPRRGLSYPWRQGLANLHRPNNRTTLLLVSLGLGTFLMLTLVLTRATLLGKIQGVGGGLRPNLMFFDVQDDQMPRLADIAKAQRVPIVAQAPLVTMKLTSVKGRAVEALLADPKSGVPAWSLKREYRSTFRATLPDTEKLVGGKFTGEVAPGSARVPVSIEEGWAKELQLKLGDELVFDVQGVPITTVVGGVRQVEWQQMRPNFFVVFPEGVLDGAPKTWVAAMRTTTPAESGRLQQAVAKELPTVSAIDLSLLLETFDSIFSKAAFVITFMAGFTVITGVIVLAGAVLSGRYQRIRETVLLRTLGATRRQLVQMQLVEYAVLGALAAVTGGLLAVGANALLARFIFKASFVLPPAVLATSVVASVIVTLVTGLLANRGIASQPPLQVLRQET